MPFVPGESGNPAGRPKGLKDRRVILREKLEEHADDIISKVVELAKGGDTTALRLCLERLVPPVKAKDDPITAPPLSGTLAENGKTIIDAITRGEIGPDDGEVIMHALSQLANITKIDDIEQRLKALEEGKK